LPHPPRSPLSPYTTLFRSAFLGALISALLLFTNQFPELQAILSWLIGGLRGLGWAHAGAIAGPVLVTIALLFAFARDLNLMLLRSEEHTSELQSRENLVCR